MKRSCLAVVACWVFLAAQVAFAQEKRANPAFSLKVTASGMTNALVGLSAAPDGTCAVRLSSRGKRYTERVTLTDADFRTFETLVAETGLLRPDYKQPPMTLHEFVGQLRIQRADVVQEFRVTGHGPTVKLVRWLSRIATEATLLRNLRDGTNLHSVASAVRVRRNGNRDVLHPESFQQPLARLLKARDDISELRAIVATLCHVTTPEEWSKILAVRLSSEDTDRADALVQVLAHHPFPGNALPSHRDELFALLLRALETEYRDYARLPRESSRRKAGAAVIRFLGRQAYKPMIPAIERMVRRDAIIDDSPAYALGGMGLDAIEPLIRLLGNPNPGARLAATQVPNRILSKNPRVYGWSHEVQDEILKRLRGPVRRMLTRLAQSDPEPRVRKSAAKALAKIEHGGSLRKSTRR